MRGKGRATPTHSHTRGRKPVRRALVLRAGLRLSARSHACGRCKRHLAELRAVRGACGWPPAGEGGSYAATSVQDTAQTGVARHTFVVRDPAMPDSVDHRALSALREG